GAPAGVSGDVVAEIKALGTRIDAADSRSRDVFGEIKALGTRIDSGETRNRDVFGEIKALGARIDAADGRNRDGLNEIRRRIDDTAKRIDAVEHESHMMAPFEPAVGFTPS